MDQYPLVTDVLSKNHDSNRGEAFLYEERHSLDKGLFSEVSSSSFLRSPIDRSLKKVIAFSEFRFKYKIDNF